MSDFEKMDLFFFITTIAIAILGILFAILLVYLIRIMNDVKHVSNQAKMISDDLKHDIDNLRQGVAAEGLKFKLLTNFVKNIFKRHKKGK